jgi:hypothetical protein
MNRSEVGRGVPTAQLPIAQTRGGAVGTPRHTYAKNAKLEDHIRVGHLFPASSDHSMEGNTASLEFCFIFGVN